jgi:hypothetical protein
MYHFQRGEECGGWDLDFGPDKPPVEGDKAITSYFSIGTHIYIDTLYSIPQTVNIKRKRTGGHCSHNRTSCYATTTGNT